MQRTTVMLDPRLIEQAKRLTRVKTTRKLLDLALRELIRLEEQKNLLKLENRVDWSGPLDRPRDQ